MNKAIMASNLLAHARALEQMLRKLESGGTAYGHCPVCDYSTFSSITTAHATDCALAKLLE